VQVREVALGPGPSGGKVWVYLPEKPARPKLPCVLIAPAGSPLIHGMELGEEDRDEHLPYVRAGFAVVAYAISGPVDERRQDKGDQVLAAVKAFMAAEAGVADARRALDYALEKVPAIDPARVYTAGHSSAATLSLLVAENEPRVKACVAFAPVTDVRNRLDTQVVAGLSRAVPGFREFVVRSSPITHVARLRCPLFLFHARDDTNVPIRESIALAAALRNTNPHVTFVSVPKGGGIMTR
jgi:dipeptidyl aminopeptidase/acylaminoacyl peptidase